MEDDDELEQIRARMKDALLQEAARAAAAPVAPAAPVPVPEAGLEGLLGMHEWVLLDLWAPWCAPCRAMEPVLAAFAKRHAGHVVVGKLNVDEAPRTAERFAVQGIPTLLLFHKGRAVDRITGGMDGDMLERWVARRVPPRSDAT